MRIARIISLLLIALLLAGCIPSVTVYNDTKIPVRAVFTTARGNAVLSPSPGHSISTQIYTTDDLYNVAVAPDSDWISYATTTRRALDDQLANAGKLTGPQVAAVVQRLNDITAKIAQYPAMSGGAACSATVPHDGSVEVRIKTSDNGSLVVTCR
jgi:hypothetical protein